MRNLSRTLSYSNPFSILDDIEKSLKHDLHLNVSQLPDRHSFKLKDDQYLYSIDLPGVTLDDLSIEVLSGSLHIQGERKHAWEDRHTKSHRYGHFSHSLQLPKDGSTDTLKAHLEHGVLFITLSKKEEAKAKKVDVSTGERDQNWEKLLETRQHVS